MELQGKKINFLGDSITEGVGATSPETAYVGLFAKLTGAETCNYGISGTRFARQKTPSENPRFDMDFCSRVEEMDPDADVIVVFGGTNDFDHGDAPLGEMEDRTVWTFYGACHTIFSSLIEKYPDKPIVIMTPLQRVLEPEQVLELRTYVQAIREVAEFYSLPVLDLFATAGIQPLVPAQRDLYFADTVHPNDAGHVRIANKLMQFLAVL
ncbi:MAG: SGNH/GDSL hydrolase family protein [Oscillospiraceae bacterium]|nr:SGNH/GDSL hydrolase family protein [Oscillospiraceae bacterium]